MTDGKDVRPLVSQSTISGGDEPVSTTNTGFWVQSKQVDSEDLSSSHFYAC